MRGKLVFVKGNDASHEDVGPVSRIGFRMFLSVCPSVIKQNSIVGLGLPGPGALLGSCDENFFLGDAERPKNYCKRSKFQGDSLRIFPSRNGQKTEEKSVVKGQRSMNRSLESKLRGAVKFLKDGTKEKPKTKHPPRKSSMEQRLMAVRKADKRM
jgi:hypothetical protein